MLYQLDVDGAADLSATAVVIKAAALDGDTAGEQLLLFTRRQCSRGATFMDAIMLTSDVLLLYVRFAPEI